jgi:hypothetical protein
MGSPVEGEDLAACQPTRPPGGQSEPSLHPAARQHVRHGPQKDLDVRPE